MQANENAFKNKMQRKKPKSNDCFGKLGYTGQLIMYYWLGVVHR